MLTTKEIEENKETTLELLRDIARPGMTDLIVALERSDFFIAPASRRYHLNIPGGLNLHSINVYKIAYQKYKKYYGPDESKWPNTEEEVRVSSLLHDVNKIGLYVPITAEEDPMTGKQSYKLKMEWGEKRGWLSKETQTKFVSFCLDEDGEVAKLSKDYASKVIDWLCQKPQNCPIPEPPSKECPEYKEVDELPLGHGEKSLSYLQDFIKLSLAEKLAIRWHMGPWDYSEYYGKKAFEVAQKTYPIVNILYISDYEACHMMDNV